MNMFDCSQRNRALGILITLALIGASICSPTGAPQSACATLKPNHRGHKAQPLSKLPYSITLSADIYQSPGTKLTVILKSLDGKTSFKGFLIAAKNEAGKAFGSWVKTSSAHELISCSAITHNDNTEKLNIELKWQPPSNATTGKVIMTAAVVQNFSIFWVSVPVRVGIQSATGQSAGTTLIALGNQRPSPLKPSIAINTNPTINRSKPVEKNIKFSATSKP